MKHLGFTGTRHLLPELQHKRLVLMLEVCWQDGFRFFHHGDCVGADAAAHKVAWVIGYKIIIHPPTNEKARAFCVPYHEIRDPKTYLERNHDIVDESGLLLACPQTRKEVLRSGTWATMRYAESRAKEVLTIWP